MHFNTKITGRDVPKTEEEWEALDVDELAVHLNREGMLKYDGKVRAHYISNHISSTIGRCSRAQQLDDTRSTAHASNL